MASSVKRRIFKAIAWIVGIIIGLPLVVAVLLYVPPVQRAVVNLACSMVSKSTGMEISVGSIHLKFPLRLDVERVKVLYAGGDTMALAGRADVQVALKPLLKGEIALSGFDADSVFYQMGTRDSAMWLRADVTRAAIDAGELNFGKGVIDVGTAEVSGARVILAMKDTTVTTPPDTAATKPLAIRAKQITLRDVDYLMTMPPVIDTLSAHVGLATLRRGYVDTGKRQIDAKSLAVSGVTARYLTPPTTATAETATADTVPPTPSDQMWTIRADSVSLEAKEALYAVSGAHPIPGLDMNYLEAKGIDILVTDFYNRGTSITVPLRRLTATERCGLTLNATGTFAMDSVAMRATDFTILTNRSRLSFNAMMGVGNMAADPSLPVSLTAKGNISGADVSLAMPAFAPMIAAMPQPRALNIDIDASGSMQRLQLRDLSAAIPGVLNLEAGGTVSNLMNPEKLGGTVTFEGAVTDPAALRPTLAELRLDSTLRVPALRLDGTVEYQPGNVEGKAHLTTEGGTMLANGSWNARREGYAALVKLDKFPVNAFMPGLGVGRITGMVDADGHGYNPLRPGTAMRANVELDEAAIGERTLRDATFKATLADSHAVGRLESASPGANLDLDFDARLDSGMIRGNVGGDIRDLDLMALGMSKTPMGGSLLLDASGSYNPKTHDMEARVKVDSLNWTLDTLRLATPSITVRGGSSEQITTLHLTNGDLQADAAVFLPLDSIMPRADLLMSRLDAQIKERRVDVAALQQAMPPLDMVLYMGRDNLAQSVLRENGVSINDLSVTARNDSLIHAAIYATGINVGDTPIDSVNLMLNQHGKFLVYSGAMTNGPGKLAEWADVSLRGFLADDKFGAFIRQKNPEGKTGYRLGTVATVTDSIVSLRFAPYDPTIAYRKWSLNQDNFLSLNLNNYQAKANLALTNEQSSLRLYTQPIKGAAADSITGKVPEELVVSAKDIQISDWVALSPFAPQISGLVSANFKLHAEQKQLVGTAVLSVDDLVYDRQRVGDFSTVLKVANNPGQRSLWADGIMWVNGKKTLTINGALGDSTSTTPFMLDLSMFSFPLEVANPFLPRDMATLSGMLNGTMKVTGSMAKPLLNGYLQFDSAAVKVDMLGTRFGFSDEKIVVDSSVVRFDDFAISTLNENPLVINGTADLSNLADISLDLGLSGEDMLVVNSSRPQGADVYGKGYLDIQASARGRLSQLLVVDANVALVAGSQVTYVLSGGTQALASQSTGDMVKFVNFADTSAVTTDDVAQTMALILNATLNIQNNTTVNVDLSTDGKNRASIMANGELDYTMTPQQPDGRLTGRLTIDGGYVRYTPPLMSEKHFTFNDGSWVSFTGDMMNPSFNISATDRLRANVTPEGGGNTRLVDFDVTVSASGNLDNMKVVFDLACDDDITIQNELSSMSAEQRANQAMNLLLYNVYTGPGTKANANLGANPLYSFLASQLNSLAANYVKGVDLSFGINQYDSKVNGASSTATSYSYQISKSLLNNRIRIVVGGNYTTDADTDENFAEDLVNDISFEYLLNRTGSMYIKVFRHKGFESILEGDVTATGVGFVYKRNLDSLRDMFRFGKKTKKAEKGTDTSTTDKQ
ncbi:MAG: translocation/assembly module TamB [Candidatus Amulumruptor caecigallinarius]|nr:translocation/assembly module TamB [Candidatus Amulumruptor caecigallinarius]MCM1397408.1 translocation/assembly module TamB [Candidatus Amulumruptor caecigallinarius]MCM1454493.1 translocation/assembly module TamB [bacterium]